MGKGGGVLYSLVADVDDSQRPVRVMKIEWNLRAAAVSHAVMRGRGRGREEIGRAHV